jgi:hypothetical protein
MMDFDNTTGKAEKSEQICAGFRQQMATDLTAHPAKPSDPSGEAKESYYYRARARNTRINLSFRTF